jgi:pimeloyl-ACP methyl ester carboxylesterase
LLLGSAGSARAADSALSTPRFESADCGFHDVDATWARQNGIECGWLHVPETRGKSDSRTLKLWTAIARADEPSAQPPLLYLHGGPGLATVDYFFPYFPKSKTWPALRVDRDLIYLDQRGTGRSEPTFCPELKTELEALRKQALPAAIDMQRTRAAFSACRSKLGPAGFAIASLNTSATVEDAEDLRRALKIKQWSVYGVSYGTLVALDYLRRHPASIHAAVLDSVYPPNSMHGHEQMTATALGYAAVQRACDRQPDCKARFPDIVGSLTVATQRLDTAPLAATDGGRIKGARLRGALWNMLVTSDTVPWVPLAIDRAAAGDQASIRGVVSLFGGFDGFGDYSPGQALAVNCHDVGVGRKATSVRLAQQRYPWLADADAIPEADDVLCTAWQPEEASMAFLAPVRSNVPTLLYGGEFDPATPFEDAVLASRHLARATVVEVAGASHATMGRDDCTRAIARSFLRNPTLQPNLACLARREPVVFHSSGLEGFIKSMATK